LDRAGIDRTQGFFTNAYVGLKAGDEPTGRLRAGEIRPSAPGVNVS
jgi:hypothetical protein